MFQIIKLLIFEIPQLPYGFEEKKVQNDFGTRVIVDVRTAIELCEFLKLFGWSWSISVYGNV